MRILQVVHNYPPEFLGGVERVVGLLNRALIELGHETSVFCGSARSADRALVLREVVDGISVTRAVSGPRYENPADAFDPAGDRAFEECLDLVRPDVVHVHHWANHGASAAAIAARRRIPAVVSLHDYWSTCTLYFRVPDRTNFCGEVESVPTCRDCLMKRHPVEAAEAEHGIEMRMRTIAQELDLAAAIICSTAEQAERLAELGRWPAERRAKVVVAPLGAPRGEPIVAASSLGGEVVIAHWGNISRVKGALILAEAAGRSAHAPNIRLRFVGRVLEEGLEAEAARLAQPAKVEFLGAYAPAELPRLLSGVHVAAFPSLAFETHSMVVDEALALGLPVIASDRGAAASRIGGRGWIARAGDVPAWTEAVDRAYSPSETEARRAAAVADPPPTFAEHAHGVEKIYKGVVGQPPIFPTYVPDFGRDRLEFRRRRLFDIHQFILMLEGRRADLEAAVRGDLLALARVRSVAPDIGEILSRPRREKETS